MTFRPAHQKLGEYLRDLRMSEGLKQSDLALLLGKPQSYISKYETAERRLDIFELITICRGLKKDPCLILEDIVKQMDVWTRGI